MTWQATPAAAMIRRAADLNETNPDAARRLWAAAAPLELRAAEEAADEAYQIERLFSAATCLIEAGRFHFCLIVLEALLSLELSTDELEQAALLFEDVFWMTRPPEPSGLPN